MKTHVVHLDNGLPVIFVDTGSFPTVTTLLLIGAGSRYETAENNGIAHFFEHMAFKGSKDFPTSFDISCAIEGIGGAFNAFTAKDHTGYWVKAPTSHFDEVVHVMSDMILNPHLDEKEIEKEKGVIIEEINMYEDMPSRRVSDVFDELLFEGHPLARDIAGSHKTVKATARKTFIDYIESFYHPKNSVVVVAGGIGEYAKYLQTIEKRFSGWKAKEVHGFEPFTQDQKGPRIKVVTKKTEQAHFCLGYPTFSFKDERRHALTLLATILGGGMSSRLFMEVREKRGLCYYVSTGRELYADTGYLVTQAGVTNKKETVKEAMAVVEAEHMKIAAGDVSAAELTRAKEIIKGRVMLSLEDSHKVASIMGTRYLFEKEIKTPEEIIQLIDDVSQGDVTEVAKEICDPSKKVITLIGPMTAEDIV